MKLLFLTPQLPYPPHQGTTIRNFNIIRQLAPRHDITLLSFGTPDELHDAEPLRALCRRVEIAPYPTRSLAQRAVTTMTSALPDMALRLQSAEMDARVAALCREPYDLVQVEGIEMARYAPDGQRHPLIFDDHNAEHVLQRTAFASDARRVTRWHAALYSLVQWRKLVRYERAVCLRADHVVACSATDARALRALMGTRHPSTPASSLLRHAQRRSSSAEVDVSVIPNGVDTAFFVPSDAVCAMPLAESALVFTGKMDFRPNVDAMTWFCGDILARIRAEIPSAHIVIVGQRPAPRVAALRRQSGVKVTGWVPDTRPFLADAAVYVVPLRMGSGTRLKVLEAMAMGKAIVSTARGLEGIELTPDRHAVIADSPDAFARAVVTLLRDPDRRGALGRNARALAETEYDWRKIIPAFDQVYQNIAGGKEPLQAQTISIE